MGNVGGGEILVILLVALIFLGPEKLPEVARQVGKVVGEIRKVTGGFQREMQDAMRLIDDAANETTTRPVDAITVEAAAVDAVDAVDPVDPVDAIVVETAEAADATAEPVDAPVSVAAVTSEAPPLPVGDVLVTEHPTAADDATVAGGPATAAPVPLPYDSAYGGDR